MHGRTKHTVQVSHQYLAPNVHPPPSQTLTLTPNVTLDLIIRATVTLGSPGFEQDVRYLAEECCCNGVDEDLEVEFR